MDFWLMWRNLWKGKGRWWRNEKKYLKKVRKKEERKNQRETGGGRDLSVQWRVCDPSKMEDTQTELFWYPIKKRTKKKRKKRKDWFNTFRHYLRSRRVQSSWAVSKGSSSRQRYVSTRNAYAHPFCSTCSSKRSRRKHSITSAHRFPLAEGP